VHVAGALVDDELVDRVEQQVRVDRAGAVADQRGEVVDLARLAGLEHEARAQADARAHEVVVHRGDGQQRRDRRPVGPHAAVGEDQDVRAARDGVVGLVADLGQPALEHEPRLVGGLDRERDVDRRRPEDVVGDVGQRLQLVVAQDRLVHHELVACSGDSSSRLRSAPTPVPRLMTISSRIGSIGGLVTCANSCLK
jgi:hypothetical protein